jgi:hypothetical protein
MISPARDIQSLEVSREDNGTLTHVPLHTLCLNTLGVSPRAHTRRTEDTQDHHNTPFYDLAQEEWSTALISLDDLLV